MEKSLSKKSFSIKDALKVGWEQTFEHIGFWLVVWLVGFIIMAVPNFIMDMKWVDRVVFQNDSVVVWILFFCLIIILLVLHILFSMGVIKTGLRCAQGEKPDPRDFWTLYPLMANYFVGSVLYSALVVVGFILFIIPGVYWAIQFELYEYGVVAKGLRPVESLRYSSQLTRGVRWQLLGFGIITVLINILGALVVFVGLLITIPITVIAYAHIYRVLVQKTTGS